MMATDNSSLVKKFWVKTHQLDSIRDENILSIIPELADLNADASKFFKEVHINAPRRIRR